MSFVRWFGASGKDGLYVQFRVMRYREGVHYPAKVFWTDRALSKINEDRVYFFSPALRPFGRNVVLGSFSAWLDFDDQPLLSEFHVRPSLVVSTGGGFHVYWRMADFCFPEELATLIQRLHCIYPTADPLAKDVTRFMRYPGTYNLKYVPSHLSGVLLKDEDRYSYRDVYG